MNARLRAAKARLFLASFVRAAGWALGGAALLAAVAAMAGRLGGPAPTWATAAALAVAALAVAALVAWRLTPDLEGVARALDRHYGLHERLSTSLELGGRSGALIEAQRADAQQHAAALDLRGFAPARLGRAQVWLLATGAAAVLAACYAPLPSLPDLRPVTLAGAPATLEPAAGAAPQRELVRHSLPSLQASVGGGGREARQSADSAAPRPPAAPASSRQLAPSMAVGQALAPTAEASANPVERALGEVGEALQGTNAPPGQQRQGQAPSDSLTSQRNDGSTNPTFGQPSARDQELREYARRRETASSPGGGGGDPVAMVDAAVAGDATAGFDGGEGAPLPVGPSAASDVNVPTTTDSSGRRVRVERLPDDLDAGGLDQGVTVVAFVQADEPTVTREAVTLADLTLLRDFNAPAGEQRP